MRKLEEKYPDELVVVGVQAGKFLAERVTANIRKAALRLEVTHPVVNDRHFRIWRGYAVNAWPTLVLVDPQGYYLGAHLGEVTFEAFDPVIGKLVADYDARGMLDRRPLELAQPERPDQPENSLCFPGKVLAIPDGRLFVSDSDHNRLLVVALEPSGYRGKVLQIIGSGDPGLANGDRQHAAFHHPQGLAIRGDVLYVADAENHAIRAVDLRDGSVTTLAGTGEQARSFHLAGKGSRVPLSSPWDLVALNGTLFIAMAGTHQLYALDLASGEVRLYAGSGREDIVDGDLQGSALAQPMGLDSDGQRLYFADSESSAVRSADLPPNHKVRTILGTGLFDYGDVDGTAETARLQHVQGIAYHRNALYIADTYNNKIKLVDPNDRRATTIYGTGGAGYRDGSEPLFDEPAGLSLAGDLLYIADTNNHAIRVARLSDHNVGTLEIVF